MIDLEALTQTPCNKVMQASGFFCTYCGEWQPVLYSTPSLEEAWKKLERYPPEHPKFRFLFAKTLRKMEGLNEKGYYGAF